MFPTMIEIDDLNRSMKVLFCNILYPRRAIAHDRNLLGPLESSNYRLCINPTPKGSRRLDGPYITGRIFISFRITFFIDGGLVEDTA
jgi:hypothetical protein